MKEEINLTPFEGAILTELDARGFDSVKHVSFNAHDEWIKKLAQVCNMTESQAGRAFEGLLDKGLIEQILIKK